MLFNFILNYFDIFYLHLLLLELYDQRLRDFKYTAAHNDTAECLMIAIVFVLSSVKQILFFPSLYRKE